VTEVWIERTQYQAAIWQFIQHHQDEAVFAFTDGSVCNGSVGCGACSAMLFTPGMSEPSIHTKSVGKLVNSVCCEMEGILLGTEVDIGSLIQRQAQKNQDTAYIMCDCKSAMETVINMVQLRRYPVIVKRLQALIKQLQCISVTVKLIYIHGHTGIPGNELADRKAREVAHDISVDKISAQKEITIHEGYRMTVVMLLKSWQHKRNEDNT